MGLASDAIFSHHRVETQMAIQIEVTLQPDYTCCLRVMGEKNPALQKLLFHHLPSVSDGQVFDDSKSLLY